MNGNQQEYDIHAQEATTIKVLDPSHVMIEQEDENAQAGLFRSASAGLTISTSFFQS